MVKRTITITTILLILSMIVSLIIVLNKSSFAAEDIASGTSGTCSWVIDSEGVLTISPTDGVSGKMASYTAKNLPLNDIRRGCGVPWILNNQSRIKKVYFDEGVSLGDSCNYLFYGLSNCTEIDMSNIVSTSNVTSMGMMFGSCSKITSLDMADWDISNVTYMDGTFYNCSSLETLDVGQWNTSSVTDMKSLFSGCDKLKTLDVSNWNTSNTTTIVAIFYDCNNLETLDVSNWNTSNVTNMSGAFYLCEKLPIIDVSRWDTSKVTDISRMFLGCHKVESLDLASWDTSKVTTFADLFAGCNKLKTLNINNWNTSNVTSLFCLVEGCTELTNLDLSNWDTSKVTDMRSVFNRCLKLETINVSTWDTSNVTNMSEIFNSCEKLKSIDVKDWDTSKVVNMKGCFSRCTQLESLDLSNWDTRKVTSFYTTYNNMKYSFFERCYNLNKIVLGENFDFDGNNISEENKKAIFPSTTNPEYTAKWLREDGEYGPYTTTYLRDNYDGSTMAGTWIRERTNLLVTYKINGDTPVGASELPEEKSYNFGEEVTVAPDATAPGYDFSGWSRTGTFAMPAENVEITGSFTPRTDTPYKVEYYLEDLKADTYTLKKTDNLTGTTDTEVTATAKEYEGFTFDSSIEGTKQSGNIAGDGSLVLKLYYKRNSYNVTYAYTGDVPNDASKLPQSETYKYGEEIKVPEDATAEGYTFSGWIKDYINMPAKDIEITGYFIEEPRLYKIEYYFDNELDEALVEILNAEKDEEINLTPQTPLKHGEKNYTLVSNNHKITITVNDEDNVIKVYYETDVLDYAIDGDEDEVEGDGIPDKYQIRITYKVQNGSWNDGTNNNKVNVITLYDNNGNPSEKGTGSTKVPEVGSKPNKGYTYGYWNKNIPSKVTNKDNGKEYVYSYETVKTIESNISGGKGKSSNPKTDDVMNRYLLAGVGGILVLILVSRIRRRYSRKAKKIQF